MTEAIATLVETLLKRVHFKAAVIALLPSLALKACKPDFSWWWIGFVYVLAYLITCGILSIIDRKKNKKATINRNLEYHNAVVTASEIWLESLSEMQRNAIKQLMSLPSLKPEAQNIKISNVRVIGISFYDATVRVGYEDIRLIREYGVNASVVYEIHPILFEILSKRSSLVK